MSIANPKSNVRSLIKVANYARYSTDRQDTRSIEDQIRRCRAYAAQHTLEVAEEYSDAAESGSHTDREGLKRLLGAAKRKLFSAVLVDDLSRLSRDLGATWRIIFEELASLGVRVVDCSTDVASDAEGARLLFGVKALVNDEFLQNVRRQTHRGLEGRAVNGFHTGGRTYGYGTVTEPNPPDPEHPRKVPVINPDEAAVVLRVFREYVAGSSVQTIAATLNHQGVAAPHDGGRGHKGNRGWGHTTIRAMLQNDRYIGVWRWNEFKWVRTSGKRSRRRIPRPEHEHIRNEYSHLRIVPADLWEAARRNFERRSRPHAGRPPGSTKDAPPLLSGLLRCGVCGGNMIVQSRIKKNDRVYRSFGCTTHYSRGAAICANGRMVSERKVRDATMAMLQGQLQAPDLVERFVAAYQERYRELERDDRRAHEFEQELRVQEQRVRNATEALVKIGWSDALTAALKAEEEKLAMLRSRVAEHRRDRPRTLLHPRVIEGYIRNLTAVLEGDSARAREVLTRHLEPLILTPTEDGGYLLKGAFNLSTHIAAAGAPQPRVLGNEQSGPPLLDPVTKLWPGASTWKFQVEAAGGDVGPRSSPLRWRVAAELDLDYAAMHPAFWCVCVMRARHPSPSRRRPGSSA